MRKAIAILAVIGIASLVFAQQVNEILQHNENLEQGVHYDIWQAEKIIVIHEGIPGEEFQFEAVLKENGQYVGPGDINLIYTSAGCENIVVTFVGHNGHEYGAAQIKEAWISGWDFAATIKELKISGDLGAEGPIWADAAGTITVGGDVLNDLVIYYGALDGSLSVGGDVVGDIEVDGAITGAVTVMGDLCTDDARLSCAALGSLTVGGDVVGDISVDGAITGPVTVMGDLCSRAWGAKLTCESLGSLTVGGDVVSDIAASATADSDVRRYGRVA